MIFFLICNPKEIRRFFFLIYNPNKSMSSYIPNSKLMKNERVLEKKEKRKKKK